MAPTSLTTFILLSCLLLKTFETLPTTVQSLAFSSSSSPPFNKKKKKLTTNNNNNNNNDKKQNLPADELAKRRKSPALWRNDLTISSSSTSPQQQQQQQQLPPLPSSPPEIMSPVGGWPQLRAAVSNGADSIYLGLSSYSARARASNFDPYTNELSDAVSYCHKSNVKVYVALNTLVFDDEITEVANLIRAADRANVDALIIQDVGVAKLAQKVAPTLEVHASTQQTVTSADGVSFAAQVSGATRIVLGRELSVSEIENVMSAIAQESLEVEAFVHGALCVSYSGQCFSSEAWGGRSANRGQCAQACRLPYGLIVDGELKDLQDMTYLLSPQDLCGLDHVKALVRAGVSCLKIEGRLKDEFYVSATTRAYRNAVDEAWDELCQEYPHLKSKSAASFKRSDAINNNKSSSSTTSGGEEKLKVTKHDLAQLFSRGQDEENDGLSSGFFDGSKHQKLVVGRSPRHRGIHVGRVAEGTSWKNGLVISLDEHDDDDHDDGGDNNGVKLGDGLVIDRGLAQEEELGGSVFKVQTSRDQKRLLIRFGRDVHRKWKDADESFHHKQQNRRRGGNNNNNNNKENNKKPLVPIGAHVWKTSDSSVDAKMKKLSELDPPTFLSQATVSVSGKIGQRLVVSIQDVDTQIKGVGSTDKVLAVAESSGGGLDEKRVRKAIGLLGNTRWTIKDDVVHVDVEDGAWCPVSWVKEARRRAVEDLERQCDDDNDKEDDYQGDDDHVVNKLDDVTGEDIALQLLRETDIQTRKNINADDDVTTEMTVSVLARNYEQVDALCRIIEQSRDDDDDNNNNKEDNDDVVRRFDEIIVDFLEVEGMMEAVSRIRHCTKVVGGNIRVVVASPRIIKPGESGIWRTLLRLEPDGLLVRSAGLLHRMTKLGGEGATVNVGKDHEVKIPELLGDFSLNVANVLTAREMLNCGLSRITAAYDLNANAVTELATRLGSSGSSRLEAVVHAHLPIFHTEHCVFARFLTKGNSYLDCGHVCTRCNVHLRDQTGADNLVLADMGCRNTVFSAQAQSGVHSIKEWADAGIGRIRIELVDEGSEDVESIVMGYLDVLSGVQRPSAVWESLKLVRDSNGRAAGVSHGSLRNNVERRAGEV